MVRHTRRRKGGSYRTPMRPIDNFHLRILNAHGSISPEYYYIVPDNVYLLLPNVCGVLTLTRDAVTQPILETPEEGIRTFRERFVQDGARTAEGAPFTVYEPGDILPVHIFHFDPALGPGAFVRKAENIVRFIYMGLFQPGSLEHLPFVNNAPSCYGYRSTGNCYSLEWEDPMSYRLSTSLSAVQNYCMTLIEYLKTKGGAYTKLLHRYSGVTLSNLTREQCVEIIRLLLPVIPENSMAPTILATENYRYSLYDIVEHCLAQRTDKHPMYILINACRSLQESVLGLEEEKIVRTMPSMSLVRAISGSVHTDDGTSAVNMKIMNDLRRKKGLPSYDYPVIKYDQLRTLLEESRSLYSPETDAEYTGTISKLDGLLEVLGPYAPSALDAVYATKYMGEHMGRITSESDAALRRAAEAANASRRVAAEASRAHNVTTYKRKKQQLQMNKKYAKSAEAKAEINAQIRNFTAKIKELTDL